MGLEKRIGARSSTLGGRGVAGGRGTARSNVGRGADTSGRMFDRVCTRAMTFVEDLIELPRFVAVKRALDRAATGAFRTMGLVARDQAEKIPDRVALRF